MHELWSCFIQRVLRTNHDLISWDSKTNSQLHNSCNFQSKIIIYFACIKQKRLIFIFMIIIYYFNVVIFEFRRSVFYGTQNEFSRFTISKNTQTLLRNCIRFSNVHTRKNFESNLLLASSFLRRRSVISAKSVQHVQG